MGNTKKTTDKTRRDFLSLFLSPKEKSNNSEKVKMLTAEGTIVEIDKAMLDKIATKQKATNKEVYDWMKNPSKEQC
jgi:hypothetical protein